ncbi:MAG: cytochrome c biogenesis protein ResB, partial [Bacteroidales bacterium]|nr:cytochrome c biogenesis protein ResB [Bacteroidales bacterium]
MKKITSFFFSMQTMGVLILLFAFSIATATFIENDFGTPAAQAVVFKSFWFEALLGLLAINLVGNVLVNKLYRPKKLTMFVFHIAFIIILLGAAITRFISYEGMMHIRQGMASNTILTDNTYVDITINDGDRTAKSEESTLLSILTPKAYSDKVKVNGNAYSFRSVKYVPNAREVVTELQSGGIPYLNLVASTGSGRQNLVLKYGESKFLETCNLQFGDNFNDMSINMKYLGDQLQIFANDSIHTLSMLTQQRAVLPPGAWYPFETKTLYQMPQVSLVITSFNPHGAVD